MKAFAIIAVTLGLALGPVGAAEAAQLFTPNLFVADNDSFECRITNVSGAPKSVRILVKNDAGVIVLNGDSGTADLNPGVTRGWSIPDANSNDLGCHFIVEGLASNFRAVGCTFVGSSSSRDCVKAE